MPGQVFISHSTRDREPVEYVRNLIEAQGLHAYLAEHDPQPGHRLSDKVRANIEMSDAVIVLLTEASIDSRFVHQEIGAARMANRLIVPLVHPKLIGEDLAMLNGSEFVVFDPEDMATSTPDLVAQLHRLTDSESATAVVMQQVLVAALVLGLLIVAFQLSRAD